MRGQDNRSRETRVNERIRAREVRVIDEEGQMLGVMTPLAALNAARERGLDLVEVQPMAVPPVCKIMDWGRFKYEQSKKDNEARKHQKVTQLREIRMKPRTGEHDIEVKIRKIQEFLAEGDKVKVAVTFRGREMAHPELGRVVLEEVAQELKGIAQTERPPIMEGRMMSMIVSRAPGWDPQKRPAAPAATATTAERTAERTAESERPTETAQTAETAAPTAATPRAPRPSQPKPPVAATTEVAPDATNGVIEEPTPTPSGSAAQ